MGKQICWARLCKNAFTQKSLKRALIFKPSRRRQSVNHFFLRCARERASGHAHLSDSYQNDGDNDDDDDNDDNDNDGGGDDKSDDDGEGANSRRSAPPNGASEGRARYAHTPLSAAESALALIFGGRCSRWLPSGSLTYKA